MVDFSDVHFDLEKMKQAADENRAVSVAYYGHLATVEAAQAVAREVESLRSEITEMQAEFRAAIVALMQSRLDDSDA